MDTSYLTTQVSTIIEQLHGLFDEIGIPSHERESRESKVSGGSPFWSWTTANDHSSLRLSQRHYITNYAWSLRTFGVITCLLFTNTLQRES